MAVVHWDHHPGAHLLHHRFGLPGVNGVGAAYRDHQHITAINALYLRRGQQVAQIAAGAMKLTSTAGAKNFTDTDDTSVLALNAAGIVEGYFSNGTSTFKPNNTLTRGQISAIVWRMQQYREGPLPSRQVKSRGMTCVMPRDFYVDF